MCGIAGLVSGDHLKPSVLMAMTKSLRHRGPDGQGMWFDKALGVGLVQTRLSVLDLSEAGKQPMISTCQRYIMSYNGEIYNHRELRNRVEIRTGIKSWRGDSDTESILEHISTYGLVETLDHCVGMFAMAIVDRSEGKLILVRDRFGEKPLYYARNTRMIGFGSELRALRAIPNLSLDVCPEALHRYFLRNCIGGDMCIYKGVKKVLPGTYVVFRLADYAESTHAYWSLVKCALDGNSRHLSDCEAEIELEFQRLFERSVRGQMLSDVPLGAFLSGGVDSSAVVGVMQSISSRPIRTFCIGFHEQSHDESYHARRVADHLGTHHTEYVLEAGEAAEAARSMGRVYDEPFSDSSQIPTWLVCKQSRQNVTVCLSGDAGDELFGGYRRYDIAQRTWRRIQSLPVRFRNRLGTLLGSASPVVSKSYNTLPSILLPSQGRLQYRLEKLSKWLKATSFPSFYNTLVSRSHQGTIQSGRLSDGMENNVAFEHDTWKSLSPLEQMMLCDSLEYLVDDILVKIDRAAMSVSLETRVPLLDHRLVEYLWRIPVRIRCGEPMEKRLLRRLLTKMAPAQLFHRPKMGFGIPIAQWLRGPLKQWALDLTSEAMIKRQGIFETKTIRSMVDRHIRCEADLHGELWDVLMFQEWWIAHDSD